MSEQPKAPPSNAATIGFIVILSVVCALVLSILSSALKKPQEIARELDRSQQMMIAARIMNPKGYFQIDEAGKYLAAKFSKGGTLIKGSPEDFPDRSEVIEVYRKRFVPRLIDVKGNIVTFEKTGINESDYLVKFKKSGYHKQPYKLIYEILPNTEGKDRKPIGYIVPVNGFGLWDAIYGYLAVGPDGNTVIGISWYEQKETPGLGANITEADWQSQFPGKHIFQANSDGTTDYKKGQIGIIVVRGRVSDVLGNAPKAMSAVDGMAGATLTGNGVTAAYKDVLSAYRPFFLRLQGEDGMSTKKG